MKILFIEIIEKFPTTEKDIDIEVQVSLRTLKSGSEKNLPCHIIAKMSRV